MSNQVTFKAVAQLKGRAVSSTGKSARGTLAGVADGIAFFVPALFIGNALAIVKAYLESGKSTPLILEGTGSFTMDRYTRNDGQKVFEPLLKIVDATTCSARLKTVAAPDGSLRLANAFINTSFEGVLVGDAKPAHAEYGQRLLLKERNADGRSAFVFVRVPADRAIDAQKGTAVIVEGRVTRLRPHGTAKPRETGIAATSVSVTPVATSTTTIAPQVEEVPDEHALPF